MNPGGLIPGTVTVKLDNSECVFGKVDGYWKCKRYDMPHIRYHIYYVKPRKLLQVGKHVRKIREAQNKSKGMI